MADLADLTITVNLDTATAALRLIRDYTATVPDDAEERANVLALVHAVAADALRQARAEPRVRHA